MGSWWLGAGAVLVDGRTLDFGAGAVATSGTADSHSPNKAATRAGSRRDVRMKDLLGGYRLRSELKGGKQQWPTHRSGRRGLTMRQISNRFGTKIGRVKLSVKHAYPA